MRDLYRALGFHGIVADPQILRQALDGGLCPPGLAAQARPILLDPVRKARYDEALACTLELAEVRSRLGLVGDPFLPAPIAPGTGPSASEGGPVQWLPWTAFAAGAMAILMLGVLAWSARSPGRPAPPPPAATPAAAPGTAVPTPRASVPPEEPLLLPPPEHGWLQLGPGIRPLVPWHIHTDPGQDYFLILCEAGSRAQVLAVYLRGGEPYEGLAPEGTFELSYTTGTRWLGPERGFKGGGPAIRPAQAFVLQAGPDDAWAWHLRLHPTAWEGSPVTPTPVVPTLGPASSTAAGPANGSGRDPRGPL